MSDSELERLLQLCRSNDVDVKVDAVTKLQAEFEAGCEIPDAEAIVSTLKGCLRHQNGQLSSATLSCLPHALPLLTTKASGRLMQAPSPANSTSSVASASASLDVAIIRQVLDAFMPNGGLLDRLSEAREKSRDNARKAIVALGSLAFRTSTNQLAKSRDGKGQEPPLAIFERLIREGGLGSKVWRVREQSILALVQIRRQHHLFPIRPYLPLLIGALEDNDAKVRDCAKQSVIELFTGPAVTDAARADLKKELTSKSVRKGIAESVLNEVAARASVATALPPTKSDAPKEYVPPSVALMAGKNGPSGPEVRPISRVASGTMPTRPASRAVASSTSVTSGGRSTPIAEVSSAEVKIVYIASDRDLETEFGNFVKPYEGKESEANWLDRDRAVTRVRGMVKGDVHNRFEDTFLACLQQGFISASIKALVSLRTTLASNTCSLYTELAVALGPKMDPFAEQLYGALLNMAGYTKKIVAQQTQTAVDVFIECLSPLARTVVPLLTRYMAEKNVQTRTFIASHVKQYIDINGARAKSSLESAGHVDALENLVKKGLVDTNPAAREAGRQAFWSFSAVWPARAAVILASLEPGNRKHVEKACPDPNAPHLQGVLASGSSGAAPELPKKSTLAAAIAASRAKAKAIAIAPPTLIHQATSASHMQAASSKLSSPTRADSPSLSSKSQEAGGSVRNPASPMKTVRSVSNGFKPSSSNATSSSPRGRVPSQTTPPLSPRSSGDSSIKRMSATFTPTTPEHGRAGTFQRAITTPLPASPPRPATLVTHPTPRNVRQVVPRASITSVLAVPMQGHSRTSTVMPNLSTDDSLLLATTIPIPDDQDSQMDMDVDMTQQDATATFTLGQLGRSTSSRPDSNSNSLSNTSNSRALSFSPKSDMSYLPAYSNSLSSTSKGSGPVVEDALRARAEQAESAAERLLELVVDGEGYEHGTYQPSSPVAHGKFTVKARTSVGRSANGKVPLGSVSSRPPITPARNSALKQASTFQDSPHVVQNGASSMMDALRDQHNQSGWWLKRMKLLEPTSSPGKQASPSSEDIDRLVTSLSQGSADAETLQSIAQVLVCSQANGLGDLNPMLVSPKVAWDMGPSGERLVTTLLDYLSPSKPEDNLEYAMIVLWELFERHYILLEGREADIFSALLRVRYSNKANIFAATNAIRDALISRVDAVFGLTTIHGSLRAFLSEPIPASADSEVRETTLAFGLMALGKFILRLPAEIVEDELPRLKETIINAFMDSSAPVVVRESAALAIIAAQHVLRDEAQLFALLDGLPDEKKNLLTYLFDKNGVRGSARDADASKFEREMRRIDSRTSTPLRPHA